MLFLPTLSRCRLSPVATCQSADASSGRLSLFPPTVAFRRCHRLKSILYQTWAWPSWAGRAADSSVPNGETRFFRRERGREQALPVIEGEEGRL
jgi:hypothetical protein